VPLLKKGENMYPTSAHDHIIHQAGLIQKGELNTSISNHLLQTAVLTHGGEHTYQAQLGKPIRKLSTWLLNMVANLIWETERAYDKLAQAAR
jgi:hypothetical protein